MRRIIAFVTAAALMLCGLAAAEAPKARVRKTAEKAPAKKTAARRKAK